MLKPAGIATFICASIIGTSLLDCGAGSGGSEETKPTPGGRCTAEGSYGYIGDDRYVCTNKGGELIWVKRTG